MDFKKSIRKIVSVFASSEFAFIYCIIGTLAQTSHTYYLVDSISSLEGIGKVLQALALSFFISSSLLFFTAIADNKDESKAGKRVLLAVNLFMVIEIIINTYYYGAHLMLKTDNPQLFDFIFAILVSCLIPVTIKLYAGVIRAKEWIEADVVATNSTNAIIQHVENEISPKADISQEKMDINNIENDNIAENENNENKSNLNLIKPNIIKTYE